MIRNNQPFYHCAETDGLSESDLKRVREIPDVIPESVEYYEGEILFTATREISESELRFKTKHGLHNDPGSPDDLM